MLTRAMAISVVLALLGTPCAANAQAIPPTKRSLADVRQAKPAILTVAEVDKVWLAGETSTVLNRSSSYFVAAAPASPTCNLEGPK